MIWFTFQWIIISLILITLLHYLYFFFKNALTVPKIRDLVNKPSESYNDIMNTISSQHKKNDMPVKNDKNTSIIDDSMQDELRDFLNELKTKSSTPTTSDNIMFESANDSFANKFSTY